MWLIHQGSPIGTPGITCCHLWLSVRCSNYLRLILYQIIKPMTLVYESWDLSRKKNSQDLPVEQFFFAYANGRAGELSILESPGTGMLMHMGKRYKYTSDLSCARFSNGVCAAASPFLLTSCTWWILPGSLVLQFYLAPLFFCVHHWKTRMSLGTRLAISYGNNFHTKRQHFSGVVHSPFVFVNIPLPFL